MQVINTLMHIIEMNLSKTNKDLCNKTIKYHTAMMHLVTSIINIMNSTVQQF